LGQTFEKNDLKRYDASEKKLHKILINQIYRMKIINLKKIFVDGFKECREYYAKSFSSVTQKTEYKSTGRNYGDMYKLRF